jgi:hypothetical protein
MKTAVGISSILKGGIPRRGRCLLVVSALGLVLPLAAATSASASTTVVVRPSSMDGWTAQIDDPTGTPVPNISYTNAYCNGSVSFVTGPSTPPLGIGSAELKTGNGTTGGDCAAQLRNSDYSGVKLSSLSALSYSTYDTVNNGQQFPYLSLFVNLEGNASAGFDDVLFFEPPYQTHSTGNPSLPNQGSTAYDQWQSWNALEGGWWDNNGIGTPGGPCGPGCPGVQPLSAWTSAYPNAVIVNDPTYGAGVSLLVGYASARDQFDGNVDAFTINATTYDFEPNLPTPTSKGQCKDGGWKNYADANGTPFKNQGDCVSYVATHGRNPGNG